MHTPECLVNGFTEGEVKIFARFSSENRFAERIRRKMVVTSICVASQAYHNRLWCCLDDEVLRASIWGAR